MCSTLIPYFAEPDDIRQNVTVNRYGNTTSAKQHDATTTSTKFIANGASSIVNVRQSVNTGLVDHEEDPVVSRLLKR